MKKKIIYITFIFLCLFAFKSNVFAADNQTIFLGYCTSNACSTTISNHTSGGYVQLPLNIVDFTADYDGFLVGNYVYKSTELLIYQATIYGGGQYSVCDISNTNTYVQDHTSYNLVTFHCPVKKDVEYTKINIESLSIQSGGGAVWIGRYGTIYPDKMLNGEGTSIDYSNYLSTINNNINNLNSVIVSEWRWTIPLMNRNLDEIKQLLSTSGNNLGSINQSIIQGNQQAHEDSEKTQQKIDETKQSVDKVNDSLTSTDVDTSSAGGFFDNFSDTDHGGIRGVISAPIKFLKTMTNTCQPIEFEIFDKKISLPCGDTLFWNRNDVQEFRGIWNCLFGGAILYTLVLKLFKVIEGLKNPDDSRIEVMNL